MVNAYPEKPLIPYKATRVEMALVIAYIKLSKYPLEVKRAGYCYFRNESGNGSKGINNNYAGVQADSGRWPSKYDDKIIGVVSKPENKTLKVRLFCAFESFTTSIDFLLERVEARGLYIGGTTHLITKVKINTPAELALNYKREWAAGDKNWKPKTEEDLLGLRNFESMYRQAVKIFV